MLVEERMSSSKFFITVWQLEGHLATKHLHQLAAMELLTSIPLFPILLSKKDTLNGMVLNKMGNVWVCPERTEDRAANNGDRESRVESRFTWADGC